MINADSPAFPSLEAIDIWSEDQGKYIESMMPVGGMTKRESIAAMAMNGLMASWGKDPRDTRTEAQIVNQAVRMTDLLFAELEKPK